MTKPHLRKVIARNIILTERPDPRVFWPRGPKSSIARALEKAGWKKV